MYVNTCCGNKKVISKKKKKKKEISTLTELQPKRDLVTAYITI